MRRLLVVGQSQVDAHGLVDVGPDRDRRLSERLAGLCRGERHRHPDLQSVAGRDAFGRSFVQRTDIRHGEPRVEVMVEGDAAVAS